MTGDKTVDHAAAVKLARKFPGLKGMDLAKVVTTKRSFQWNEGTVWPESNRLPIRSHQRLHVVAYDFGIKRNILRLLADFGCRVTVVPGADRAPRKCRRCSPMACFSPTAPAIRSRATTPSPRRSKFLDDRLCRCSASASVTRFWVSPAARRP